MESTVFSFLVVIVFAISCSAQLNPYEKSDKCKDEAGEGLCKRFTRYRGGLVVCQKPRYKNHLKRKCALTCGFCKPKPKPKCHYSEFGCCWDKKSPAKGPSWEGCPACKDTYKGCQRLMNMYLKSGTSRQDACTLSVMIKHCPKICGFCALGALKQPKCLRTRYGCCWNFKTAKGPNGEGCISCRDRYQYICPRFQDYCHRQSVNAFFIKKNCPVKCGRCRYKQRLLDENTAEEMKLRRF